MNAKVEVNDRATFLQNRLKGIGGSDVATILGLSKYKSPYQLWLEKTGRETSDVQSEPAYWGTALEDVVAKEFQKRTGLKVQKVNQQLVHPGHDWVRANIDRAVINPEISGNVRLKDGKLTTDQILECKTANAYLAKLWGNDDDSIPDYYMTQCQWYMGITGATICHLAVLIGGQDFRIYSIAFDQELFDVLLEECGKFWHDHVLADIPPALTTYDDISHKWQKPEDGKTLEANADLIAKIQEYKDLKNTIKQAEEELDALKLEICTAIGDCETVVENGKKLMTYKYQERTTIDSKQLKADNPKLWQQYAKTSGCRVLR